MEALLNTLSPFFEHPNKEFLIREVSRLTKTNHTTIRQHIINLTKDEYLKKTSSGLYPTYRLNETAKTLNLKLYFNLEKIRESELILALEKHYDYPIIVLFGSYSKALDTETSDIDMCIISEVKKEPNLNIYEKSLKRNISIHHFTKQSWNEAKQKNPGIINSICNGIIMNGQLEVI